MPDQSAAEGAKTQAGAPKASPLSPAWSTSVCPLGIRFCPHWGVGSHKVSPAPVWDSGVGPLILEGPRPGWACGCTCQGTGDLAGHVLGWRASRPVQGACGLRVRRGWCEVQRGSQRRGSGHERDGSCPPEGHQHGALGLLRTWYVPECRRGGGRAQWLCWGVEKPPERISGR